jgi:hypothetical protein
MRSTKENVHLEAVQGACGPEQGLADGEAGCDFGGDGIAVEFAPEFYVFRAVVGAAGEEQRGAGAGEIEEVVGVGDEGPFAGIVDQGIEIGRDGAYTDAVDQLEVPERIEGRGEELAGAGEQIVVEE